MKKILIFAILLLEVYVNPFSAQTTQDMSVEIEVENSPAQPLAPNSIFDLEPFANRDRAGFRIWTNQGNFWESGDTVWSLVENLDIQISFDSEPIKDDPFIYWSNSSVQEVLDNDGQVIGSFLQAPMTISFGIENLELGNHKLTVKVRTTSGNIYEQAWDFVIREHPPRQQLPNELTTIAEYLEQNPLPLPDFILKVPTESAYLERFQDLKSSEGICIAISDKPFDNSDNDPFRTPAWQRIDVIVDGKLLLPETIHYPPSDTVGAIIACVDTNYLANGIHIATIRITVDNVPHSYTWAFRVIGL